MLALPGIIEADDVQAMGSSILRDQTDDGLILWFPGGHADAWNHVESAMALNLCGFKQEAELAFEWLAKNQHANGWWHHYYLAEGIEDAKIDTNTCAYVAAGIWHHWLLCRDLDFLARFWPVIDKAINFVITMQKPRGEFIWARHTDGTPWSYALLTGSSSILHSLRCAIAIARELGHERSEWELAAAKLADVLRNEPAAFEPKNRWAMDWYYPVLSGALSQDEGIARLALMRDTFIMPGKGVRCVSDNPWITAAETAECAIAYASVGLYEEAEDLMRWVTHLKRNDGSVYTGIVYPELVHFPDHETSTYTAAAMVLAADALSRSSAASGLFVDHDLLPELSTS